MAMIRAPYKTVGSGWAWNNRLEICISYDNEIHHRNNGVCANNEVFGGAVPPKAFFFFTERLKDMTQKQKKAVSKSAKPTKIPARGKGSPAVMKAAPARIRPAKIPQTLSENEVRQRAYSLWEGRGSPIGSPEEDWYLAKKQLSPEKSS
jgi:DUF2934 family protein